MTSGIGKSTLCYCLSGIIPHVYGGVMEGQVYLNGRDTRDLTLPQIATTLGIVFQNPDNQLFSFTVEDEVAFGPENLCLPPEEIEHRITDALKKVGMSEFRHANPQQLSGGQRQLIALASVLTTAGNSFFDDHVANRLDGKLILDMILK